MSKNKVNKESSHKESDHYSAQMPGQTPGQMEALVKAMCSPEKHESFNACMEFSRIMLNKYGSLENVLAHAPFAPNLAKHFQTNQAKEELDAKALYFLKLQGHGEDTIAKVLNANHRLIQLMESYSENNNKNKESEGFLSESSSSESSSSESSSSESSSSESSSSEEDENAETNSVFTQLDEEMREDISVLGKESEGLSDE